MVQTAEDITLHLPDTEDVLKGQRGRGVIATVTISSKHAATVVQISALENYYQILMTKEMRKDEELTEIFYDY